MWIKICKLVGHVGQVKLKLMRWLSKGIFLGAFVIEKINKKKNTCDIVLHSNVYEVNFLLRILADSAELHSVMPVWITEPSFKVTGLQVKKNLCAHVQSCKSMLMKLGVLLWNAGLMNLKLI